MKSFAKTKRFWRLALLWCGAADFVTAGCLHAQGIEAEGNPGRDAVEAMREIDDPEGGARWLLYDDGLHPGGPGRLVAIPKADAVKIGAKERTIEPPLRVIVRGGERVTVEQQTKELQARFEAVALGPARSGEELDVRLRINGRKMRVVALAPGRVLLRSFAWERP